MAKKSARRSNAAKTHTDVTHLGAKSRISGRVFRFAYYGPPDDDPEADHPLVDLHALRDSDAFVELSPLMYGNEKTETASYSYGGLVLNHPAPRNHPKRDIKPIDESFLSTADLLVLTTRPPLDDKLGQMKVVRRSYTSLEQKILNSIEPYFETCSRDSVALSHQLKSQFLKPAMGNRGRVEYRVKVHDSVQKTEPTFAGSYMRLGRDQSGRIHWDEGSDRKTGVYLIYLRPAWPNGPALLSAFGMTGPLTLLWAHFLGTRPEFAAVLDRPRFLMAEIELQTIPADAARLSFADAWRVETLLDCPPDSVTSAR